MSLPEQYHLNGLKRSWNLCKKACIPFSMYYSCSINNPYSLNLYRSLLANRLSGRIPKYLGNISTLTQLYALCFCFSCVWDKYTLMEHRFIFWLLNCFWNIRSLESDHFIGTVPAELGNLRNLTNLYVLFFYIYLSLLHSFLW